MRPVRLGLSSAVGDARGMNLRIDVSDADIAFARRLWDQAVRDGAEPERVERLLSDYVQLISAQAQQIADDFRRTRANGAGGA